MVVEEQPKPTTQGMQPEADATRAQEEKEEGEKNVWSCAQCCSSCLDCIMMCMRA